MITKYTQYIKENNNNSQFFTTYDETKDWLYLMKIRNFFINNDLIINVDGSVDISSQELTHIPVKFGVVNGHFDCSHNKLTTLEGSPDKVNGYYYAYYNKISNVKGLPNKILAYIDLSENNILSILDLSIYNLKKTTNFYWYTNLNKSKKEEYFDFHLENNPEIISLINFESSYSFNQKWNHLLNANKFDLI